MTLPPGPRAPRFLQFLAWGRNPLPLIERCAARYGDSFTLRLAGFPPQVFFSHPQAIKDIFSGSPDRLHAGKMNWILEPLVGRNSLILLDGEPHLRERKLMLPPFHAERMQAHGDAIARLADASMQGWPRGRPFPIHQEMRRLTLDVIMRVVFGFAESDPLVLPVRRAVIRFLDLGSRPSLLLPWFQVDLGPLSPWSRMLRLKREVHALVAEAIARRRAEGEEGRSDVLSMLLRARYEDGEPMTDVSLRDEIMGSLVAGHETSATALAWTLYHVLHHPEVRDRIGAELRAVVGRGPLLAEHLPKLTYLEATIKETLRLTPVFPVVGRHLEEPFTVAGRELPAGVRAVACLYLTHRRPEIWPEPASFRPERFFDMRPTPYEYLPFGGGVRRCLGMALALYEMKIVLARVFSRAELSLRPGYRPRVVQRGITLAPSGGVPVVVDAISD